jgi:hypothetical protein
MEKVQKPSNSEWKRLVSNYPHPLPIVLREIKSKKITLERHVESMGE